MHVLQRLVDRGLQIDVQGDRLVVAPRDRIDDELRMFIRENKPVLLDLVRTWRALEAALTACCAARHDSEENLQALLADCWREPADDWPWLVTYFNGETARFTH